MYIKISEKTFSYDGVKLKYLLYPGSNKTLIVGFQACSPTPVYNYVRSLNCMDATRLYIKDDFARDHRGSYYLGTHGNGKVEKAVLALIDYIENKMGGGNPPKMIFIGSSKGGYSALNFCLHYDYSFAVIAAPQYLLGNYLNCDIMKPQLEDILGVIDNNRIKELNSRLRNKIYASSKTQRIFIHYSDLEHTFSEHICYLLRDLRANKFFISEDIHHYIEHGDLYKYYPRYLVDTVKQIINDPDTDVISSRQQTTGN